MEHLQWATKSGQSGSTKYRRWWRKLGSVPLVLVLPSLSALHVRAVQLPARGQVGALGRVRKEFEPVLSMSIDLRRCPQLVPVWPASGRWISRPVWFAGSSMVLLPQAAGILHGWRWQARLGRMPAAPFRLGRPCTCILAKVRVKSHSPTVTGFKTTV